MGTTTRSPSARVDLCRGRTVVDLWNRTNRLPNAHVGVDLGVDHFFDLLVERIASLG